MTYRTLIAVFLVTCAVLTTGCASRPDLAGPSVEEPQAKPEETVIQVLPRMETEDEVVPSNTLGKNLLMADVREAIDKGDKIAPEKAAQLIELAPDDPYVRLMAGWVYLGIGDRDNAGKQFIRSLELDPANHHASSAFGEMARSEGDLGKADLYFTRAYEAAPTPQNANRLALLRMGGGYLASAREILTETLVDHPENVMTRNNLALAMDMTGATLEGIDILDAAPTPDPRLLRTKALLELKEGHPDRAASDLEITVEAGKARGEWLLMGTADLQKGDLDKAEDRFRSAIIDQPSDYEGYLNLGLTLRRQGKFTEAEKVYKEGLAKAPHPDTHLNLGVLYELYRGEQHLALTQYRKYIELGGAASERVRGWVEYLEGVVEGP